MDPVGRGRLLEVLEDAGHPLVELGDEACGYALVLPHGGRVLGLFSRQGGENYFWVNPCLASVKSARQTLNGETWVNTGGDRTWLAPEREIFVRDLSDAWGTYHFPAGLDPGRYVVRRQGPRVEMENRVDVFLHQAGVSYSVIIRKTVHLIPNPLRFATSLQEKLDQIEYAGYEQETRLRITAAPSELARSAIGIWNVLVLPAGGEIIVPTLDRAEVVDFFEPTGSEHLSVSQGMTCFRVDGAERHKVGLRAISLIGRAGYRRALGDGTWTLVVRSFSVNPSGEYVDVPWHKPDDQGCALEMYNDNGSTGLLGELEYHSPAVGGSTRRGFHLDRSQVWAFRAERTLIQSVAMLLLGVRVHG